MTTTGKFKFKPKLFKYYIEQFTLPEFYGPSDYMVTFVFPPRWKFWDRPYTSVTNLTTHQFRYMTYAEAALIGEMKPQTYDDICMILDRARKVHLFL